MINAVAVTADWYTAWCPNPQPKNLRTQFGVHLEEIAETLLQVGASNETDLMMIAFLQNSLAQAAQYFKTTDGALNIKDRVEFLDGLCDTMVTSVGLGHMTDMNVVGGFNEVNRSNNSKFVNGKPILDDNLKMQKGPDYSPPVLTPFV